jgi:hypothetical protein
VLESRGRVRRLSANEPGGVGWEFDSRLRCVTQVHVGIQGAEVGGMLSMGGGAVHLPSPDFG